MRLRRLLMVGAPVLLLLIAAVAWAGWQVWRVHGDLSAAVDDAQQLESAVLAGDTAGGDAALSSFQDHSGAAADVTDGATWTVLTKVPFLGDDASGVRVASQVAARLGSDGIEPLLQTSRHLDGILPRDGRVPIPALRQLQAPVARGARAFATADAELASQSSSSFVGPLREQYQELTDRVSQAGQVLRSVDIALRLMPTMLGGHGPRHYLLVFQNNAEIRATGGLPGAVALVSADQGKVRMLRQVPGASFGERATPVQPLTPAEREIYGNQLGTYFVDANFTPDFPRAAALMRARWQEVYGGHIDGVVSIDPVALSYLLKATGPVQVGDVSLTADNAVRLLLHDVYLRYGDPAKQDAWFRRIARAVFNKFTSGGASPIGLARALARGADEHRIFVHSFHPAEQAVLDQTTVATLLPRGEGDSPQVGLYLNDGTGSKMSYYLRYQAAVQSTACIDSHQTLSARVELRSAAPRDAASLPRYITGGGVYGTQPGHQLIFAYLFGPASGDISDLRIDGRPVGDVDVVLQEGRPVLRLPITLAPQKRVAVSWDMTSGTGQTGAPAMSVTPSIVPGNDSSTAPSSCLTH